MRRFLTGAALAAASAVLLVVGAGPAAAHTDTGTFSATRAEPAANGTTTTIDLLLTYDNDGHGAEDAVLAVTVQGPSGAPVPVTMAPGDRAGAYTGDVATDAAGDYTVTASSTEPEAETTFTFTVAEASTTTTAADSDTTTTAADTGTTTTTAADDEGGDGNLASIVANGALLAIGAAVAFFAIRWWRKRRGGPTY